MSWYAGAEKASPLLIGTLLVVGFVGGWEASGQVGGKISVADVQKDYVLRSEAARAVEDREKYAQQIEKLQNKIDKFELTLFELKEDKKSASEPQGVSAPPTTSATGDSGMRPALREDTPKTVTKATTLVKDKAPTILAAMVFDPPSNVRRSPNGKIVCWISEPSEIRITGSVPGFDGIWYYTDACDGQYGVIHQSQIEFR